MTGPIRTTISFARACVASVALLSIVPLHVTAQQNDLTTIFDLGSLLSDNNGDSVPDLINASLLLGDPATSVEHAAAAEISARLGFETMALDLPLARGVGDGIPIVIGRGGLAASGLSAPGIDPTSLDASEGSVSVRTLEGRTWIFVIGGDDEGLLAAARLFAGVLPHTRTLSTANLERVREDLSEALESADVEGAVIRLTDRDVGGRGPCRYSRRASFPHESRGRTNHPSRRRRRGGR
jgi:hypothetical protein